MRGRWGVREGGGPGAHATFPCEPDDCQQGSLPSMSREAWFTEDDTVRDFTIRDQLSSSVPGGQL